MRKRVALALGLVALAGVAVVLPVGAIELGCRPSARIDDGAPSALPPTDRRAEARTWLTYPEWHIVYSAESLGQHLAAGRPPSGYDYGDDVMGFWRSFCGINRLAGDMPGTGEAKLMIYTIGISFTAEMAVKAAWENVVGRLTEWIGGWDSAEDRYAAAVQQRYGAFMNEVPWYRFDFGGALAGLWRTHGDASLVRRPERRIALTSEYGVKAVYAKAIGAATGTMAPDARTLRLVVRASPAQVRAADPRLRPLRALPDGRTIVEAPRYAQFTTLVERLAGRQIDIDEIAGNRWIFVTVRGSGMLRPRGSLLAMKLGNRPGWWRYGVTLPVSRLTGWVAAAEARGAELEHVYDY